MQDKTLTTTRETSFCNRTPISFILQHLILSIPSTLPISQLVFHLCLLFLTCAPASLSPALSFPPAPVSTFSSFILFSPPSPPPLLPPCHPSSSGCPCTRLPALLRSLIVPVNETQLPPLFCPCLTHLSGTYPVPPALIHHSRPLCISR